MTISCKTSRRIPLASLLLLAAAGGAEARDFLLHNESNAVVDKVYARPADPSMQGEMYGDFRLDGGGVAPGSSSQFQVSEEFCQYDLLVTFDGAGSPVEALAADLCWHPHVIVGPDYISLM